MTEPGIGGFAVCGSGERVYGSIVHAVRDGWIVGTRCGCIVRVIPMVVESHVWVLDGNVSRNLRLYLLRWFSLGHSRRAIFPWLVFFEYFPNEKLRESYWYKEYAELQELKVYEEYLELSKSRSKRNSSFIGSRSLSSRTTLPVDFRKLRIRRRNWFPRNLMFKCERKQTVKFTALKCNFASSQHATFVS